MSRTVSPRISYNQEVVESKLKELGLNYFPFVFEHMIRTTVDYHCPECNDLTTKTLNAIIRYSTLCDDCKGRKIKLSVEEICKRLDDIGLTYYPFEYIGSKKTRIRFHCIECNDITEQSVSHLIGGKSTYQCRSCWLSRRAKFTQEEVENKLKEFDIEYKSFKYVNSSQKIEHKCPSCNEWKFGNIHDLITKKHSCKCKECGLKERKLKHKHSQASIELLLNEVGCIFLPFNYEHNKQHIFYECFECSNVDCSTIDRIIRTNITKCKECSWKDRSLDPFIVFDILEEFNLTYKPFTYSKLEQNIEYICPKCKQWSTKQLKQILNGRINCLKCNLSSMELLCYNELERRNIIFDSQKTFEWLKHKSSMFLDFYLPNFNIAIECQGKQHFEIVEYFGGKENLKLTQHRDKLKKKLCEENGITIHYINYDENVVERIKEILNNY